MIDFALSPDAKPVTVTLDPTEAILATNAMSLAAAIFSGDPRSAEIIFKDLARQIAVVGPVVTNGLVKKLGAAAQDALPGIPVKHYGADKSADAHTPTDGGLVS